MKKIIVFLFLGSLLLACEGDCMKCHPRLLKDNQLDKDHKVLTTCIECHQPTNDDLSKMGALCGQDCWDCHSIAKVQQVVTPSHMVLDACIKCHVKLKKDSFGNLKLFSSPQMTSPSLKQFLKQ
jgi:hypothetical protein